MNYPEFLYVSEDEEGRAEEGMFVGWLCEEDPHSLADIRRPKRPVGVYRLMGTGEIVTSVAMEPTGDPTLEDAGAGGK